MRSPAFIALATLTGCSSLLDLDRFSAEAAGSGGAGAAVVVGGQGGDGGDGGAGGGVGGGPPLQCNAWSRVFHSPQMGRVVEVFDVEPLDDCGAIAIVHTTGNIDGLEPSSNSAWDGRSRSWVVRLDANGEVAWQVMYECRFGARLEDAVIDGDTIYLVGHVSIGNEPGDSLVEVRPGTQPLAIDAGGGRGIQLKLGLDGARSEPPLFSIGYAHFHAIARTEGVSYIAGHFRGTLGFVTPMLATCNNLDCAMVLRDDGQAVTVHTREVAALDMMAMASFTHLAVGDGKLAVAGPYTGTLPGTASTATRGIMMDVLVADETLAPAPMRVLHSSDVEELSGLRMVGEDAEVFLSWGDDLRLNDTVLDSTTDEPHRYTWLHFPDVGGHRLETWSQFTGYGATSSTLDLMGKGDGDLLLAAATNVRTSLDGSSMSGSMVGTDNLAQNAFWARLDADQDPPRVIAADTLNNPQTAGSEPQRVSFVTARGDRVFLAGTYDGLGSPVPNAPPGDTRDAFLIATAQ